MEQEEKPKSPKRNKPAENVTTISHLISDVMIEILIRLPIRFFLYVKSVSKEWQSLITNPLVIRWRPIPDHKPAVGLFLPTRNNDDMFEYLPLFEENPALKKDKDDKSPKIRILSSCNGLLLCQRDSRDYVVYNPTTSKYSPALPRLDGKNIQGMSLAFDPAISRDHYKVVCVHHLKSPNINEEDQFQIEIYSSDTPGLWISSVAFAASHVDFSNGVYWNRAINWANTSSNDRYFLYFNIHREVLNRMPRPPVNQVGTKLRNYYFGESCDHLHYIHINWSDKKFDIYEMRKDYSEWFVKYHVDLSPLVDSTYPLMIPEKRMRQIGYWQIGYWNFFKFYILSVVRGDQEEEEEDASFLVLQIPGKAIRYNIVPKTFETLREYEVMGECTDFVRYQRINAFQYIESLCIVESFV